MRYHIVIDKDPGSDWWASVPSLPGCYSSGETVEELRENVKEAIKAYVASLMAEGLPAPPSDPDRIETVEVA